MKQEQEVKPKRRVVLGVPVLEIVYTSFDYFPLDEKIRYVREHLGIDERALLFRNTGYYSRDERWAERYVERLIRRGTNKPGRNFVFAASTEKPEEFTESGVQVFNADDGDVLTVYDQGHFREGLEYGNHGHPVPTKYRFLNPDEKPKALVGVVRLIV